MVECRRVRASACWGAFAGLLATAGLGAGPAHAAGEPASRPVISAAAFDVPGLDPALLGLALAATGCAEEAGVVGDARTLTVIDFRLPSTEPRLWVLDLVHHTALFHERVAHGRNTGEDLAVAFSNRAGSNESSVGLYRTGETYSGRHGRALRLDGLEPGFNDHARDRGIVVHAADYCTSEHVDRWGRLGRSEGCPALDPAVSNAVIDVIADGTPLFAYYPEPGWLAGSAFLTCAGGADGLASAAGPPPGASRGMASTASGGTPPRGAAPAGSPSPAPGR
jgi:hypothetical protein